MEYIFVIMGFIVFIIGIVLIILSFTRKSRRHHPHYFPPKHHDQDCLKGCEMGTRSSNCGPDFGCPTGLCKPVCITSTKHIGDKSWCQYDWDENHRDDCSKCRCI